MILIRFNLLILTITKMCLPPWDNFVMKHIITSQINFSLYVIHYSTYSFSWFSTSIAKLSSNFDTIDSLAIFTAIFFCQELVWWEGSIGRTEVEQIPIKIIVAFKIQKINNFYNFTILFLRCFTFICNKVLMMLVSVTD